MATGPSQPRRIRINLQPAERAYDVLVGPGLLAHLGALSAAVPGLGRAAMLVADTGLPGATIDHAATSLQLAGFRVGRAVITPTEPGKSLATLEALLAAMTRERLERKDVVIALGGGIVGDTAGFAAATYRRGIPFIQCPTTLLSMVDASVGGKTGVNLAIGSGETGLKKNMVGAFHQPRLVLADVAVLASLPTRHFRSGLGECIKHGLIGAMAGDASLGEWTKANLAAVLKRDGAALSELIARNIAVKARIVEKDEREESADASGRIALNLGHTFAHALETIPALNLQHGEAVGLGLIAAARCSVKLGRASAEFARDVSATVEGAGLPTHALNLPHARMVVDAMRDDKKVAAGKLRIIVPVPGARCEVVDGPPESIIAEAVESLKTH